MYWTNPWWKSALTVLMDLEQQVFFELEQSNRQEARNYSHVQHGHAWRLESRKKMARPVKMHHQNIWMAYSWTLHQRKTVLQPCADLDLQSWTAQSCNPLKKGTRTLDPSMPTRLSNPVTLAVWMIMLGTAAGPLPCCLWYLWLEWVMHLYRLSRFQIRPAHLSST